MILNDEGKAALNHYNSNPATIEMPDGHTVDFIGQWGVALAWVDPQDVPYLLEVKIPACCNRKRLLCSLATQEAVNVWLTGRY